MNGPDIRTSLPGPRAQAIIERDAKVESLRHIVGREVGDEGAAARPDLDQPLGGQAAQRLLGRRQAHAQPARDVMDVQALAGKEDLAHDGLAQAVVGGVAGALPPYGCDGGVGCRFGRWHCVFQLA